MPLTNPNAARGMHVAVVVPPAPKAFTTAKAPSVSGPACLGLDGPCRPAVPTVPTDLGTEPTQRNDDR